MASFAPIRGTQQEINATPRVDGQFLVETDQGNLNKIYIDTYNSGTATVERTMAGGGGHAMTPDPNASLSDATIVSSINAIGAQTGGGADEHVISAYSVSRWTNDFKKTFLIKGAASNSPIGATGVGEWQDPEDLKTTPPSESDEIGWKWWYIAEFDERVTGVDIANDDSIKIEPIYDNKYDEDIVLGGYIIDTSTGYCCIRFGNSISDTENVAVGFEVTYKRNEVSVLPLQPTP